MLAKAVVIRQSVFGLPLIRTIGGFRQCVGAVRLTGFVHARVEVLVEVGGQVVREAAGEFQTGDYVGNLQRRGAPHVAGLVVAVFSFQQADGVHYVTVSICEVGTILGDVVRVFCRHATPASIQRVADSGTGRHINSRQDRTGVSIILRVLATAVRVLPNEVFGHGHPLVQLDFAIVAHGHVLLIGVNQDTLVVVVGEGDTVGEVLRTHVQGYVMTLIESRAEDGIHPVRAGGCNPRVAFCIPAGRQRHAGIGIGLLTHPQLLLGVQRLNQVGCLADAEHAVIRHGGSTFLGLLGRHQDNAAGTGLGTIDGGRGGVLQDYDALNIVHGGNRCAGHAVYHPQHIVAVLRTLAADDDVGRGRRVTTVGRDGHARQLALQHAFRGSHGADGQFIGILHDTHGGRQVLLAGLCAITQDNHFVQHLGIFFQDDVQLLLAGLDFLRGEAHIADDQNVTLVGRDGKLAVNIGDDTRCGPFHHHIAADDGQAGLVLNYSCNGNLLGECPNRYEQSQQKDKECSTES